MKKINEIIIVEGKTDTAIIKKLFDADTIETNGFQLSDNTLEIIKEASKSRGIIILTDPDYPGMEIRRRIQEVVESAKHAFVDKEDAVKKGKLGIAEARDSAIINALENVVTFGKSTDSISWSEFVSLDIIGNKNKRLMIYKEFNLGYGNVKILFKRLNMIGITKTMIVERLGIWQKQLEH